MADNCRALDNCSLWHTHRERMELMAVLLCGNLKVIGSRFPFLFFFFFKLLHESHPFRMERLEMIARAAATSIVACQTAMSRRERERERETLLRLGDADVRDGIKCKRVTLH